MRPLELYHSNFCKRSCEGNPAKCPAFSAAFRFLEVIERGYSPENPPKTPEEGIGEEGLYASGEFELLFKDCEVAHAKLRASGHFPRLCKVRLEADSDSDNCEALRNAMKLYIHKNFPNE